jgi:hypothetical protein
MFFVYNKKVPITNRHQRCFSVEEDNYPPHLFKTVNKYPPLLYKSFKNYPPLLYMLVLISVLLPQKKIFQDTCLKEI